FSCCGIRLATAAAPAFTGGGYDLPPVRCPGGKIASNHPPRLVSRPETLPPSGGAFLCPLGFAGVGRPASTKEGVGSGADGHMLCCFRIGHERKIRPPGRPDQT